MIGVLLPLAVCAAAFAIERRGRAAPEHTTYDAIIVLGCPVAIDGAPSAALRRRAVLAAELFHAGRAARIVTTGGTTRRGRPSEAAAAARVLIEASVPEAAIVLEERSLTTQQNAAGSRALLPDARRVLVVTDAFHVPRALMLFRPFFPAVEGAGALGSPWARAKGAVREVPLVALYGAASWGRKSPRATPAAPPST